LTHAATRGGGGIIGSAQMVKAMGNVEREFMGRRPVCPAWYRHGTLDIHEDFPLNPGVGR